jgi:hypothetical protein
MRGPALLAGGVVAQVAASRVSGSGAVALGLVALMALGVFAVVNLHLTGMGVLAIGLGCNFFTMAANGGMPVSREALVAAHVVPASDVESIDLRGPRHLERPGDVFRVLGDIIPIPGQAVSFGDLIIAVAAADVVTHVARRQRRRAYSINIARPVHDWGIAPSPVPSSASQYSASPEDDAPRTLELATSAPARQSR